MKNMECYVVLFFYKKKGLKSRTTCYFYG